MPSAHQEPCSSIAYNDGGGMNQHEQKMWLLVDGVVKKLKRVRYWTTSADDYHQELMMALHLLEEVLRKINKEE